MDARLWIVIVNYRTARLAAQCLRSLAAERASVPGLRVVVADNASGDGSVEDLQQCIEAEGWRDWVSVLPMPRNGGFAYGNNGAIRRALRSGACDYLLLLNPDTVCRPGALRALLAFMQAHPRAGIGGSLLEDEAGAPVQSAHHFFSPLGELEAAARLGLLSRLLRRHAVAQPLRGSAHPCDWVSGAALMVRRAVLDQVGPLDEGYFLYFEEVDFCRRARQAGWEVWSVPASRVQHLEGAATGIRVRERRRPAYWFDSRRRYFVKHHGVAGLLLADALWAAGRTSLGLRRLLRLGSGGTNLDPQRFAVDLIWGDLRALFDGELWNLRRPRKRSASS